MIRLCGAALGLFAFSVTVFLGMAAGNPIEVTIGRAVGALFVFCLIGLGTGWVASRVLDEHAATRSREMFPDQTRDEAAAKPEKPAAKPVAE